MSEPSPRPAIASAPISVILFAQALTTDAPEALEAWRRYLDTLNRPYEIILIQETRPDLGANEPATATARLRIFPHERAIGFREALNDAIRSAQYPLLAFAPCARSYQPGELDRMLKMIDQVDLVVGYRTGGAPPPWRVLLDVIIGLASRLLIGVPLQPRVCWLGAAGWGRRLAARWVFGVRVADPECPFRLARREIFQRLPIQSSGSFVTVEMLAKANHLSCLLAEEPVAWTPALRDEALPFGADAWRVFTNPDFGAYPPAAPLALESRPVG